MTLAPGSLRIVDVCVARVGRLVVAGGEEVDSGIRKRPVEGPVAVGRLGLAGDEQADLSVHGGPTRAVYAYPVQHRAFWRTVRAQARVAGPDDPVPPGLLGENLGVQGIDEGTLWIGDRFVFPDCELAVSEARYPCNKFNAVMGFNQAAKLMVQSAWCGAYLGVIATGTLQAGQEGRLVPGPREINLRELFVSRTRPRQRG